jgi:hypothetical protein
MKGEEWYEFEIEEQKESARYYRDLFYVLLFCFLGYVGVSIVAFIVMFLCN